MVSPLSATADLCFVHWQGLGVGVFPFLGRLSQVSKVTFRGVFLRPYSGPRSTTIVVEGETL